MASWAYSNDLRERAVAAYERSDMTEREVAEMFGIGEASLRRWRRKKRETGSVAPAPHGGGGQCRITGDNLELVRRLVAQQPDATVDELVINFVERTNVPCSHSTMTRTLKRLGLTRKKRR